MRNDLFEDNINARTSFAVDASHLAQVFATCRADINFNPHKVERRNDGMAGRIEQAYDETRYRRTLRVSPGEFARHCGLGLKRLEQRTNEGLSGKQRIRDDVHAALTQNASECRHFFSVSADPNSALCSSSDRGICNLCPAPLIPTRTGMLRQTFSMPYSPHSLTLTGSTLP